MKTFKIVFLTFTFSILSFTIDAADFDCGCSTSTPAGSISTGYNGVNGDCCNQAGGAEVISYNAEGEMTGYTWTDQDVTSHCDAYSC